MIPLGQKEKRDTSDISAKPTENKINNEGKKDEAAVKNVEETPAVPKKDDPKAQNPKPAEEEKKEKEMDYHVRGVLILACVILFVSSISKLCSLLAGQDQTNDFSSGRS